MSKVQCYTTKIVLHDLELQVDTNVILGDSGDYLTPSEPDTIIILSVLIGGADATLLLDEAGFMDEILTLTTENYNS